MPHIRLSTRDENSDDDSIKARNSPRGTIRSELFSIATAVAGILAEGTIKLFWKRKRPSQVMDDVAAAVNKKRLQRRPSFPSGHAAGYLAATTTIALCFPGPVAWVALAIGALGAYSRIYNGVHFPTDVLAGSTVGILCAIAMMNLVPAHIPPVF